MPPSTQCGVHPWLQGSLPVSFFFFFCSLVRVLRSLPLPPKRYMAAAKLFQTKSCLTLCNPIDGTPSGSPSLGFSRQEHWSGLPFPSPMHESEK